MKKIIIGAVLIIVIAGFGVPFVSGLMMEKVVRQSYVDVNTLYADNGSDVSVEVLRYERGFLSSEIEWKLKLGNLRSIYGIEEILFVDRAEHKFLNIVSKTSLEKNEWFTKLVNDKLNGKNPIEITTQYNISGKIESTVKIDSFSFQVEDEIVEVKPGLIVTGFSQGIKNIYSDMSWEGMTVDDKIILNGISAVYDLEKFSTYIWAGELSFAVEKIKAMSPEGNFEINGLKGDYTIDFSEKKNLLSFAAEFGADSFKGGAEPIEDATVTIAVNNLDSQAYEDYMKMYAQVVNSAMNQISSEIDDPAALEKAVQNQMAMAGVQMIAASEKFLKKGLEIKISDLKAKLSSGKIYGDLNFRLRQDVNLLQLAPLAAQPFMALELFDLESELSFPAVLVEDPTPLVSPFYPGMQTGVFKLDGKKLVHKARTKNGKLLLNDEEVVFN